MIRGLDSLDGLRISWLDFKLGGRMLVKYPGLTLTGGGVSEHAGSRSGAQGHEGQPAPRTGDATGSGQRTDDAAPAHRTGVRMPCGVVDLYA